MNFRTRALTAAVCAVALLGVACSSTRSAGEQIDDAAITTKITTKLAADPEINPFNIDVDTLDGVVTLRGEVEKAFASEEAERLAMNTDGVKRVRNQIRVQGEPGEDDESVSDAGITTKIKAKLAADPDINPFNIDVDTLDGHVTLSGVVETSMARSQAEDLARNTDGVHSVTNEITLDDD